MTQLELIGISKCFPGNVQAVDGFDLAVHEGDFVVLVGPSGCGKTTALRMIAGLEDIDEGRLFIDGQEVTHASPKERGIAMIFQDYALYPHLTVYENIAFPLRMHRFPKTHIKGMVEEIAHSLHIHEVLGRKPNALSGGQRQRVAIARALVRKPKLCLMDEPFSNLDAQLRVQMRDELARIHREHNMTTIFVTHDQVEAMALGTHIVVMKDGVVQQIGSPRQLYHNPENLFVACFFGMPAMNTLPATLSYQEGSWSAHMNFDSVNGAEATGYALALDQERCLALSSEHNGAQVVLGIRPEHIKVATKQDGSFPSLVATIERVEEFGSESFLYALCNDTPLIIRVPPTTQFSAGNFALFSFDSKKCHLFDAETGVSVLHAM
ncbi:MAG: ABC transporter ATP-binding protein [Coriobacteriia bacterium]|nr:ABC transporter ATP-binding protein [Coriobacteriia bacterium]